MIYFILFCYTFEEYFDNCPVLRVPGRVYPVDIYHSKIKQIMTAKGPSNSSYVQVFLFIIHHSFIIFHSTFLTLYFFHDLAFIIFYFLFCLIFLFFQLFVRKFFIFSLLLLSYFYLSINPLEFPSSFFN